MTRSCAAKSRRCARRPATTSSGGCAKSEKRLEKSIDRIDQRTRALEERLDTAEQDRRYAEWRIHTNNEAMLDGLLREVRTIADLFARTR